MYIYLLKKTEAYGCPNRKYAYRFLSNEQIEQACKLVVQAQAHFVKTSTGFGSAGATIEHVKLMRETVGQFAGVKAAGGIRNATDARAMIEAGATRLGTSGGVAIVSDADNVNGY